MHDFIDDERLLPVTSLLKDSDEELEGGDVGRNTWCGLHLPAQGTGCSAQQGCPSGESHHE